jgi:hypothetical protein
MLAQTFNVEFDYDGCLGNRLKLEEQRLPARDLGSQPMTICRKESIGILPFVPNISVRLLRVKPHPDIRSHAVHERVHPVHVCPGIDREA